MVAETNRDGRKRYEEYWQRQMEDLEFRSVYQEESPKKDLWLQLI
jgi:hypothetical protein